MEAIGKIAVVTGGANGIGEGLVRLGRRHHFFPVLAENPLPGVALLEVPRNNRPDPVNLGRGPFRSVEATVAFPVMRVGPVAAKTFF